jgi:glycosyltransferase involved in cell wall biosynthesis
MRVLFLQRQPCVKTLKYAVGLRAAAPDLELGFAYQGQKLSELYGGGDELFDRWWRLDVDPRADLGRVLDDFAPHVVHSHNLPDVLSVLALELAGGQVPVVHDVHDFQSLRRTPYEDGFPEPPDPIATERAAVEGCDALITVSPELLDEIGERYRLPERTLVFPNYALQRDLPVLPDADPDPDERAGGRRGGPLRVVYQGTLSVNGGHYDLRELLPAVVAAGASVDVHPARAVAEYRELAVRHPGLRCHEPMPARDLLNVLPRYDLGWAGFNASVNGPHLDTVLPNKAFEYVACGLPVLTLDHRALRRWVGEHGVGISVATVADLADRLADLDLPALQASTRAVRERFTVEANIAAIVDLYVQLIGPFVARVPCDEPGRQADPEVRAQGQPPGAGPVAAPG